MHFEFQTGRVAIVHYWLLNRRGGERVVEALCELFPQADLFTLVADPRCFPRCSESTSLLLHSCRASREAENGIGICCRCIRWPWNSSICVDTTW